MDDIFEGIVGGLIVAWILTLFHVNKMLIEVLQPFTEVTLTNSTYYVLFIVIGLVIGIIKAIKN